MSAPDAIPLARPSLGEEEVAASARAIRSGWVTQGPEVLAFEREFAEYVGAPYACAVSNCTVALHLALRTVGVGPGDEVITVSHSFIATANSIRHCGAIPVFADIATDGSYNLDPARIESLIGPRTKAILCVHQIGMPSDLARILPIARRHGLRVIEDAACAIGSEILSVDGGAKREWERIGRPHGDIACFSFHPRKLLTTGDGGMLTTANPEWDRAFRLGRQHGMSVSDVTRHASRQVVFEDYSQLGYNYRMTDIQAAVGREQLRKLPALVAARREAAERYALLLAPIPGLGLPREPEWARTNWQSYCVRLPDGVDQRAVMQTALDQNIATRRGIMCSHREEAFRHEPWRGANLTESEGAQDRCVMLPLFHDITEEQQARVAECLARSCS